MTTNGGPAQAASPEMQPQLTVVSQYIKDFSFENPNAPQSLA
ncbi:MAG: protein-export chaperone SecB, partial [Pseudolabrys sp.]